MAGEDVDLKVLRAAVALGEGKAVALNRSLASSGTKQHLVDGKRRNFCSRGLVDNPRAIKKNIEIEI